MPPFDKLTLSSVSDENVKRLFEIEFDSARARYYAGEQGPFALPGTYSEATYEALCTVLESKWRLGWDKGIITLYGDPGDLHELAVERIATDIKAATFSWILSHPDAPDAFRDLEGMQDLFNDSRSARHKWMLTPISATPVIKEPDCFFRTAKTNAVGVEDGVVVEVAHCNEDVGRLVREVVDWTRGKGDRALVAVGLKIDTKPPHQRDPLFHLIVRNVSPSTTSINTFMYSFGCGSDIPSKSTRDRGPTSVVSITDSKEVEDGFLQHVTPVDRTAPFIVDVPIGAAIFHDIEEDSFPGVPLTSEFVAHLKRMVWKIDLGYLRHRLTQVTEGCAAK